MKMATLAGLLLCGVMGAERSLAATVSTPKYPHVPLVMWSERPLFHDNNAYYSAVLDGEDVTATFRNALSRDMVNDYWKILSRREIAFPNADVLCVFLRDSLRSHELSQLAQQDKPSYVQNAIADAKSSVVIPHTTRPYSLSSALKSLDMQSVAIENLGDFIRSDDGAILTDGKPDILVVRISADHSLAETDRLIEAASIALLSATSHSVDFALTGDEAEASNILHDFGTRRVLTSDAAESTTTTLVCETGYLIGYSGGKAFCFSHYVHMTPQILIALFFGFFFIFLAYVGLSVLNAIQTPLRYPLQGPPRGKEF